MAGSRPAARLERYAADAGAKLIEFRDSRQLQSVLAGGELQGVHERLGGLALSEIVRQRDPEERRALGRLHAGDVEAYITHQEQRDRIAYDATIEQAVAAYSRNVREVGFDQAALVVPTNAMAQVGKRARAQPATRQRRAAQRGCDRRVAVGRGRSRRLSPQ